MEAFELYKKVPDYVLHMDVYQPTSVWACGKCRIVAREKETADNCCTTMTCDKCGHVYRENVHYCEPCWDRNRAKKEADNFEKAETVWDWNHAFIEDRYFDEEEEIEEYLYGQCLYADDSIAELNNYPDYIWACEDRSWWPPDIVDWVREHAETDTYEDASDHLTHLDELRAMYQAWCDRQKIDYWVPSNDKKVDIRELKERVRLDLIKVKSKETV